MNSINRKAITRYIYQHYSLSKFYFSNLVSLLSKFLPIKSYSDFGEDKIVKNIAPAGKISYVDIGSGHPIIGNNTYYFYRLGCNGVTIDPILFHSRLHKLIRPKDKQINKLISNSKNERYFYEYNPTQYSTTDIKQYKDLKILGILPRKIYKVRSISVNSAIDMIIMNPFFISIDCEGYDYEILSQIDSKKLVNAFAIIIEHSAQAVVNANIARRMKRLGFALHDRTNNNLIYIKQIRL